jgi:hypothetical protein
MDMQIILSTIAIPTESETRLKPVAPPGERHDVDRITNSDTIIRNSVLINTTTFN